MVLTAAGDRAWSLAQRAILTESLDESLAQQADGVAARPACRTDGRRATTCGSDDAIVQVLGPDGDGVARRLPASAAPAPGRPRARRSATVELPAGAARLLATPVGADTVLVAGSLDDVEESIAALVRVAGHRRAR